jgi:hypothetical protein
MTANVGKLPYLLWAVQQVMFLISARHVRFSNRPVGVKRFQTIHGSGVDVSRGLVLLYGIGTQALIWGFFSQEV